MKSYLFIQIKPIYPGKSVKAVDLHLSDLLLCVCMCVTLNWPSVCVCTWSFSRCQTNQGRNSSQCRETVVIVSWWIFNPSLAGAPVTPKVTTVKTIWNISRGANGGCKRMCADNSWGTSRNVLIECESLVVVRDERSIRPKLVSAVWLAAPAGRRHCVSVWWPGYETCSVSDDVADYTGYG